MNTEIKFCRYFEMVPPTTPLLVDVIHLMHRTMDLVNLLYWKLVLKKGLRGATVMAKRLAGQQKNSPCIARPDPKTCIERESSDESMNEEMPLPSSSHAVSSRHCRLHWLADVDLETHMAYGRALMSGHGMLHFLSSSKPYTLKISLPRP